MFDLPTYAGCLIGLLSLILALTFGKQDAGRAIRSPGVRRIGECRHGRPDRGDGTTLSSAGHRCDTAALQRCGVGVELTLNDRILVRRPINTVYPWTPPKANNERSTTHPRRTNADHGRINGHVDKTAANLEAPFRRERQTTKKNKPQTENKRRVERREMSDLGPKSKRPRTAASLEARKIGRRRYKPSERVPKVIRKRKERAKALIEKIKENGEREQFTGVRKQTSTETRGEVTLKRNKYD